MTGVIETTPTGIYKSTHKSNMQVHTQTHTHDAHTHTHLYTLREIPTDQQNPHTHTHTHSITVSSQEWKETEPKSLKENKWKFCQAHD